jgi:uncharacterized lipoprotein YddW (UPF0748 family)
MTQLTVQQDTFFKKSTAQRSNLGTTDTFAVKAGQAFEVVYAHPVADHCLVRLKNRLGTVGKLGYFYMPAIRVQAEEIRGVWLTNVDSEVLNSLGNLKDGLKRLKAMGFNTLYPAVWQRGFTLYPSEVAKKLTGSAVMPNSVFEHRDMLAELIQLAKPMGFRVIPWFEYGLMIKPGTPIDLQRSHLITLDKNGKKIRIKSTDGKPDRNVWMNPCHPDVQRFMIDLITDVVARYDIDGIQLDDHFSFPRELGYDRLTQDLYKAENQSKPAPLDHTDPQWVKWASSKMTNLLVQIYRSVKAKNWDCMVSISPNPLTFSVRESLANWQAWMQIGLIDELALQVYRDNLVQFNGELDKAEVKQALARIPVVVGIMAGQNGWVIDSNLMRSEVRSTRLRNCAGTAFFFYESLFYKQISPKVARNPLELQILFT